jgi:RNA polymerase sigma-70 factor, ECF subfamily
METFRELVVDGHRISGGAEQLRGWIFRAAYHNVLDHRRARGRRPEDPSASPPEQVHADDPVDRAVDADVRARVQAALAQLPEDQATVLGLRFLAQMSAPEIAAVMGRSEGSVRQLQNRGTRRLAQLVAAGAVPILREEAP